MSKILFLLQMVTFVFSGDFSTLSDNTWTRIADAPGDALGRDVPPGRGATWVYEPNTQKFLRYGGYTPTLTNAMDEFDPATKTWTRLFAHDENYPTNRPGGGCNWMMAYDSVRSVVWLCGGWSSSKSGHLGIWKYEPINRIFTQVGNTLGYNTHFAFNPGHDVIVASPASTSSGAPSRKTMVFNLATEKWEARDTYPLPQTEYSGRNPSVFDPSINRTVLVRGSSTLVYDAAANKWENVVTTGAPPAVLYTDTTAGMCVLAYDPGNQAILWYGNSDGRNYKTYLNQTWIYKSTAKTWTRLNCPGIPVNAQAKTGIKPIFYHRAIAYYPAHHCFLMCDPDLGVWAFRYNPASPAGTTVVDAESLVVGDAAKNAPATGPGDVFRTLPSALNPRFLNMGDNTLLRIESGPSFGNEIRWDYDPDLGILVKYGGCGNGSNPYWGGYGNNLTYFDPGTETWYQRRTSDASGIARPSNGCGRSTFYDSKRKKWWLLGGVSGEPYPCLSPSASGPWSYDFQTDVFTGHNVASTGAPYLEGGVNLIYSPEHDMAIVPGTSGQTCEFDFTTLSWRTKTGTGGPGSPASHAGNLTWVPTLHSFLCFSGGKTWAYNPDTARWVDLNPTNPPPAREVKMGFAYDSRNDIVLLVAGYLTWDENPVNDMWAYHPSTNTWEALNPAPTAIGNPRNGCQQTSYDSRHNVFFIGVECSGAMFAYRYKTSVGTEKKLAPVATNDLSVSPNPFRSATILNVQGSVQSLKIYDARGRLVRDLTTCLFNGRAEWKTGNAAAGLYFAVLKTGKKTLFRKCLIAQ